MARPKTIIKQEIVGPAIVAVPKAAVAAKSEKEKLLELYKDLKDLGIDPPSKLEVMIANAE